MDELFSRSNVIALVAGEAQFALSGAAACSLQVYESSNNFTGTEGSLYRWPEPHFFVLFVILSKTLFVSREPRDASRSLRRNTRAFGSLP
jgi:hypothetical protein